MCLILYLFLSQGERIIRKIGQPAAAFVINRMDRLLHLLRSASRSFVTGIAKLFNLHVSTETGLPVPAGHSISVRCFQ